MCKSLFVCPISKRIQLSALKKRLHEGLPQGLSFKDDWFGGSKAKGAGG